MHSFTTWYQSKFEQLPAMGILVRGRLILLEFVLLVLRNSMNRKQSFAQTC